MNKEIWKDIPNYEGLYQISNFGRLKNVKRNKIKKQTVNRDGYYVSKLSKNNKKKVYLIHRLVAETFLDYHNFKCIKHNDTIYGKKNLTVNHKDENKQNNNVNNLEWCTNEYNIKYSCKNNNGAKKIKNRLYNYMKLNNVDSNTINIVMNFFK